MEPVFSDQRLGVAVTLAATVLAFCLVVLLHATGGLETVELLHHDRMMARTAAPNVSGDVVIVTVEEEDLAVWGWPLPDHRVAEILTSIHQAGPAVIGLDIYRDTSVGAGAEALRQAFDETGAIAVSKLGPAGGLTVKPPEHLAGTDRHGFSDVPVDRDGVVRRALLLVNDGDGLHLSLALRLALRKLGQEKLVAWPGDPRILMLDGAPLPPLRPEFGGYRDADTAGYQIPLGYSHALPVAATIPARTLIGSPPNDTLRDKVVLIGVTSESIKDHFRTPLNSGDALRFTYGAQVHASTVQNLLDVAAGRATVLRDLSPSLQNALILAAALTGAVIGWRSRSGWMAIVVLPGLVALLLMVSTEAFRRDLWLPAVPMLLALICGGLLCFGTLAMIARRQRRIIATLFSDHLSPELAADIWRNRSLFMTGGKPQPRALDATVIFLDIAGSTAIGGTSDPEAYMAWISRILDALSAVARSQGGFIEKFTGDGMLIAFGAPVPRDTNSAVRTDAEAACRCAIAMADRVIALNAEGPARPPYRIRMGLHSGPLFGGVLGHRGTLQYNLLGDTVNVAARIEAFGKRLKDRQDSEALICLSGVTLDRAKAIVDAEPVGTLTHDDGSKQIEVFQMRTVR